MRAGEGWSLANLRFRQAAKKDSAIQILLSAVGTRGDVEPILALASAANDQGHRIRLCVPPNFVEQGNRLGFDVRPLGVGMRAARHSKDRLRAVTDLITDQFNVIVDAARGCDLIIGGGVHQYAARSAADIWGLDCAIAAYSPTAIPSANFYPGRRIHQCGPWMSNDERPLPSHVEEFLEKGDPPNYIGFGSRPVGPAQPEIFGDAARSVGRRILFCQGWSEAIPITRGKLSL